MLRAMLVPVIVFSQVRAVTTQGILIDEYGAMVE
jgi:hypothetical protein